MKISRVVGIVCDDSVADLKKAVETAYPRSHPDFADKFAVHSCKIVDGVKEWKIGKLEDWSDGKI